VHASPSRNYEAAQEALESRFLDLLDRPGEARAAHPGEVSDALTFGTNKASTFDVERAKSELGNHECLDDQDEWDFSPDEDDGEDALETEVRKHLLRMEAIEEAKTRLAAKRALTMPEPSGDTLTDLLAEPDE
jgi:hypothetical protein